MPQPPVRDPPVGPRHRVDDLDLQVTGYGPESQGVRQFDGSGGTVLNLWAGTGNALTFTVTSGIISAPALVFGGTCGMGDF